MCLSFVPTMLDVICDLLLNRITVTWSLFVEHVHVKMMNLPYDFDNNSNVSKIRTICYHMSLNKCPGAYLRSRLKGGVLIERRALNCGEALCK